MLISREKHQQLALLEGEHLPVRSLQLGGLQISEGQELFRQKGQFMGSETEWHQLMSHYGGHPLALKLVATATQALFDGRIAEALNSIEQGWLVLDEIHTLFEHQFDCLPVTEQEMILYLANHQRSVSLTELSAANMTVKRDLLGTLNSLLRSSLIEKVTDQNVTKFRLQPILLTYVRDRLSFLSD
jgi:hypothetical protein